MLTIVFFLHPVYTIKKLRKTNSIHLEILKERDAMVVIRECANINIKVEEKEEKQDMCKAIDDMMKDARMSGEALGEARGRETERKIMQEKLDEKQNQIEKERKRYEKEIEELKRQLAERQTA